MFSFLDFTHIKDTENPNQGSPVDEGFGLFPRSMGDLKNGLLKPIIMHQNWLREFQKMIEIPLILKPQIRNPETLNRPQNPKTKKQNSNQYPFIIYHLIQIIWLRLKSSIFGFCILYFV